MQCKNHPQVQAVDRCAACAEAFCPACLVEIKGQKYCGACKVVAVQGTQVVEQATVPCKEADEALKYAIFSLFCFGFILGPVAISKAVKAKQMMNLNPQLAGSGKAMAAIIIGTIGLLLWVLGIISRVATMPK